MRFPLALPRHDCAHQRRLAGQLAIHGCTSLDFSCPRPERQYVDFDPQLIARRHRPAKFSPLNSRENY
jgi:hypothetical protein